MGGGKKRDKNSAFSQQNAPAVLVKPLSQITSGEAFTLVGGGLTSCPNSAGLVL